MAVVKIADVVVPEVYDDYFMENSIYKSAVWRSGIVVQNPQFKTLIDGGATVFNLPFWQTNDIIGAAATAVDEDTTLTAGAITADRMISRRQFREKAFGSNDLAAVLAGDSPMDAMITALEAFWNKNYQNVLFKSVQGVVTDNEDNDSSDMVNDITGDGDPYISSDAVIDTVSLFGDEPGDLSAITMHSVPYNRLQKNNLIDFNVDNAQNIGWGTYLGKTVIVDDTMIVSSVYWTVLFKPGAFGFAETLDNASYVSTEVERKPEYSGGRDLLYTRRVFLMHPYGFAWQSHTETANSPIDAELALAANWDRVAASIKNTGFVVLKTSG